ncbi:2-hydroxychromene-2-carboxylate isomerase [Acuticoccus mangrovi]|uniref:2-hydroxychromene-2-carboxylate isomerase n=1 Tax=Acuticoccus mangrovi TaxID=2796142 RepID=A0A934IJM8_9HYPH|nr:DsbA family protein [Acuticoccus mangrovi]MBJ3776221.1 DsbA family protein [Acuticoccus mangrovi]
MALMFWYDFSSTYSYLAAMRIAEKAAAAGVEVTWHPFLLGPIFAEAGHAGSPNLVGEAKAGYMWMDIGRRAAHRGIPFVRPAVFPQKSVAAGRAALALEGEERAAFSRAVFGEIFGKGRDCADLAVLADAATAAGLDPERVVAGASDATAKAALFAAVDEAKTHGIFGAPSFVTHDGALFWGDDRLDHALHWERTGMLPEGG